MYPLYYKGLRLSVTFQVKHLCVGDFASFAKIFAGFYFGKGIEPGTYLFAGADEGQNVLRNYTNFRQEGFAFAVGISDNDSLMPMYRFQNLSRQGTYLYVGSEERNSIINNPAYQRTFREEGVAFYVMDNSTSGGTPFYRFQNTSQPGTYLFVGEQERQSIINNPTLRNFREEGVAFRVSGALPSGSSSRLPEPVPSSPPQSIGSSSLDPSWVSSVTEERRNQVTQNIAQNTSYFANILNDVGPVPNRGPLVFDPLISAAQGT